MKPRLDKRQREMISSLPDGKRFEYVRMSGKGLAEELDSVGRDGMTPLAFCSIFGVAPGTMRKWLAEAQDIPPWVYIAFVLLNRPGALREIRSASANHIIRDLHRPELGEFPFISSPNYSEYSPSIARNNEEDS